MRKAIFFRLIPALSVTAVMLCAGRLLPAQSSSGNSQGTQIEQPQRTLPPDDPDVHPKAFNGVIVKSGDKLVLLDTLTKTTYQLDDQEKAKEFLNKNVKVTGVLNPASGTIHVNAIDPV